MAIHPKRFANKDGITSSRFSAAVWARHRVRHQHSPSLLCPSPVNA